jgi:hypothetical protein
MRTNKTYGIKRIMPGVLLMLGLLAGVALLGANSVNAQTTTYTPPAGYTSVSGGPMGVYYNPTSGLYFYSGNNQFTPNPPAIPSGYQTYGTNTGVYYNPSTGSFYNPITGQYSNITPLGPAARDANGNYIIPSGYSQSVNGSYYNPSTGLYYDPMTGFYSTTTPLGPVTTNVTIPNQNTTVPNTGTSNTGTYNPGLPNTGAGGTATNAMALVVASGLVSIAGLIFVGRRMMKG